MNGKISFGYDRSNRNTASEGSFLNGAVSVSVSTRLGAQLDIGATDDSPGAGLHLFVRDPDRGLIGICADHIEYDTTADTALNFSAERAFDEDVASIGVTRLDGGSGTQFAVLGRVGTDDDDAAASIGVTMFFGHDGLSLQEIQRQNNPPIRLNTSATRSGNFDAPQAGRIREPLPCTGQFCDFQTVGSGQC